MISISKDQRSTEHKEEYKTHQHIIGFGTMTAIATMDTILGKLI